MNKRPNVLCIISDDTDPEYLGCYGREYQTPHLDRLAEQGMRFTRAQAMAPVCTPSRYAYLTGQIPGKCPNPIFLNTCPPDQPYNLEWNVGVVPGQTNLASLFQANGYTTGYIGKYHAGRHEDVFGCEPIPADASPYDPGTEALLRRNQQRYVEEMRRYGWEEPERLSWGNLDDCPAKALHIHNTEWLVEGACNFLERHAEDEKPFLLYVATQLIHGPSHGPDIVDLDPRVTREGLLDRPPQSGMPTRASILERLQQAGIDPNHRTVGALWLDDAVGTILAKLHTLGLAEDTIVIYKADHGVMGKGTVYNNGTRVPLLWKWPEHIRPGSRSDVLVQNIDFVPTLAGLLNLQVPEGHRFDGSSYAAQLAGSCRPLREEHYNEYGTTRSVETSRWKYISFRYRTGDLEKMKAGQVRFAIHHSGHPGYSRAAMYHGHFWDADQLYDLHHDPDEQINLAGRPEYQAVLQDMKRRLDRHLRQFQHPYPREADPYQSSGEYKRLVEKTREDDSLFVQDWYQKGAW